MDSPFLFKLVSKLKDLHLDVTLRLVLQYFRIRLSWTMLRVLIVFLVRCNFVAWTKE
jgi:hypothetical protein